MSDTKDFKWTDQLVKEFCDAHIKGWVLRNTEREMREFKNTKEKDIPKPDWEILSFGFEGKTIPYTDSECERKLIGFGYSIHSVKRLSDGEIFSIGDSIADMKIGEEVIEGFKLNYKGNNLWVFTNIKKGYGCSFEIVRKKKVPLFVSEDGVEIFDYNWCTVYDDFTKGIVTCRGQANLKENYKRFSSEYAADRYIELNKPVKVTYQEIEELLGNCPYDLKAFFKAKINL